MTGEASGAGRRRHSKAELVSMGIAALVLSGIVGAVLWTWYASSDAPARFEVRSGSARRVEGRTYLGFTVRNQGDRTGKQVKVTGTLGRAGRIETASTTFDYVAGRSQEEGVLVFDGQAVGAALVVESFQEP